PRLSGPAVTGDGRLVVITGESPSVSGVSEDGSLFTQGLDLPPEVMGKVPSSDLVSVQEAGGAVVYSLWGGGGEAVLTRLVVGSTQLEVMPTEVASPVSLAATDDGRLIVVGLFEARALDGSVSWDYSLLGDDGGGQPVFGRDRSGFMGVVPFLSSQALLVLRADGSVQFIDLRQYGDVLINESFLLLMSQYPVLVDLDDDGRLDVLTLYGRRLMAFSQDGALVRGFPIKLPALSVAQPLVAELSDSGAWSIVVASTDGYVYAYDLGEDGRLVPGFPLAVGYSVRATPLLQDDNLYAVSQEGALRAWKLANVGEIWWGQLYGNAQNQSFVELAAEPPQPSAPTASLIVEAETYNWPNPIREGQTFLRCMTTEDAAVRITIIDAAGSLIDEVTLEMRGGTPAEHLWQTNAASGLYYARITATGPGGETATKLIKMAIIR
ncbi:MAG: hypothetical protein ACE10K_02810, partial [Rhodothermales bacterium]